jgi:2-dehydropantoate 2-reductase
MDVIFLGESHRPDAVGLVQPLTARTTVVSTQNGVPGGIFRRTRELTGLLWNASTRRRSRRSREERGRVIAYFATDIVEPGVIRHTEGNRLSLGEPDGTRSDRCKAIPGGLSYRHSLSGHARTSAPRLARSRG